MTNSDMLEAKIKSLGYTVKDVATKLGMSRAGFYKKLNNLTEFKASEISKLTSFLSLTDSEREQIFFAALVDNMTT